jgi:immune inhibitor InhA-like protein
MRKLLSCAAVLGGLVVALAGSSGALADRPATHAFVTQNDTYSVGKDVRDGTLPVDTNSPSGTRAPGLRSFAAPLPAASDPPIGTVKTFLILDDFFGIYRLANFTLRGVGTHAVAWVQNNATFPAGDCRNNFSDRIQVTDSQVNYLLNQFDTNIWPKEADAFSVAPAHDGSNATLPGLVGLPQDYYAGDGDKTVILISNVRDDNYYDTNNAHANSYIAGFFSGQLNDFFDRNVMTVDSYDWLHRTTENPPGDPNVTDLCAPVKPRPFLYEGTFAHEYQHLLEHYSDPDEVNWINEGLSDWAMSLTGYAHPELNAPDPRADGHVQTFLGAFPPDQFGRHGGPENSLTRWQDQGPGEILADYGAAYTMMTYLDDHYGNAFMSALHKAQGNGLAGLDETLAQFGQSKTTAMNTVNNWAVAMATDGLIDGGARILGPYDEKWYSSTKLNSFINWANPDAYDSPGAPTNGSDYVRFRDASGGFLSGRDINSLTFKGSTTLPTDPILWSTVTNAPGREGNSVYFGGATANRDATMTRSVTVPTGSGAQLSFDGYWNEETGWDFGFVQVSTDGGATYTSLSCPPYTTSETDPGALPTAKANVPGFTGIVNGWQHVTCSLAPYAGQTIALQFRSWNDPLTFGADETKPAGFWVDNITVGSQVFDGTSMAGWQSMSEFHPAAVANFVVTILSVNGNKITVKQLPLTGEFAITNKADVQKYIDKNADLVAAVVTYDDPTEGSVKYAPYQLTVNGVTQPGGS